MGAAENNAIWVNITHIHTYTHTHSSLIFPIGLSVRSFDPGQNSRRVGLLLPGPTRVSNRVTWLETPSIYRRHPFATRTISIFGPFTSCSSVARALWTRVQRNGWTLHDFPRTRAYYLIVRRTFLFVLQPGRARRRSLIRSWRILSRDARWP